MNIKYIMHMYNRRFLQKLTYIYYLYKTRFCKIIASPKLQDNDTCIIPSSNNCHSFSAKKNHPNKKLGGKGFAASFDSRF